MDQELTIRSEEAIAIATDLAQRLDRSTEQVVEAALRSYEATLPPRRVEWSEDQKIAFLEKMRALGAQVRAEMNGEPAPDVDALLYDEHGLPR